MRQALEHRVEQRVLEQQVVDGVPAERELGKTATATPSSWQARTWSRTVRALTAGSATVTGTVHAATRAKPWS